MWRFALQVLLVSFSSMLSGQLPSRKLAPWLGLGLGLGLGLELGFGTIFSGATVLEPKKIHRVEFGT